MTNKTGYSAKDITTLEPRLLVRHRVGMYLGSNSDEGITKALLEITDNVIDETLGGHGTELHLTFHPDGSAEIQDYGRGLPVDENKEGINGIILTVGTVGSGGKFDTSNYEASGGMNGVGSAATNFTSRMFEVTVYRAGKQHQLSFKEGIPGRFATPHNPDSKFTPNNKIITTPDPRTKAQQKAHPTGTNIRFWPDYTVFVKNSTYLMEYIKFQLKSTAFLVPGINITINNNTDPENPHTETYKFDGGLPEMITTFTGHEPILPKPIHIETTGTFTEERSILQPDGSMKPGTITRNVQIDTAFTYTQTEDTILKSYVNIINTKNGGTHESGLWRALSRILINKIKTTKGLLKPKEEPPTLEDIKDGFVGALSIKFPEPTYTGQEKSNLATKEITSVISQAVGTNLEKWLNDKKNATTTKALLNRIVDASRIRLAAKELKDVERSKKTTSRTNIMPDKLVACSNKKPEETSLLLCEGDSALGGLKPARDARTIAIYPLRGKPLNIYDLSLGKVLANNEWKDLIQIIGAGMGKDFDLDKMRYHKIILVADADVDGAHIRALLISGIWRLMRPLIEAGRLYIALPPLFSITTKGKNRERHYALTQEEVDVLIKKLAKEKKTYDKIQRHKGLGEYSPEILQEVIMNPETRSLKQITLKDVESFEKILNLTLSSGGKSAENRREWIIENRELISEDQLDLQ